MDKLLEIVNTIRLNKGQDALRKLSPEDGLRRDLGFDSLDLAELTVRIEAEFGVDVFDDGVVSTVGETLEKISNAQKRG